MKKILLLIMVGFLNAVAFKASAQTVALVKYSADADVKVCITDSLHADLIVYQTSTADSAGTNNGVWFFANFSSDAQKRLFFVESSAPADLNIFYTTNYGSAGWLNTAKQYLMN